MLTRNKFWRMVIARSNFVHERAERAENTLHVGEIGYCRECGKRDPRGWTLICRRRRCEDCRNRARVKFESQIFFGPTLS